VEAICAGILLIVYFCIAVGDPNIKRERVRVSLPGLTLLRIYYNRNL